MSPLKLRGHHFLCILGYIGLGYTKPFTQNFDAVVERISRGDEILIVSGIDDICSALQGDQASFCDHASVCSAERTSKRDEVALQSIAKLFERPDFFVGKKIQLEKKDVMHLRENFRNGTLREACLGCEWFDICTDIAQKDFANTKLFAEEPILP